MMPGQSEVSWVMHLKVLFVGLLRGIQLKWSFLHYGTAFAQLPSK